MVIPDGVLLKYKKYLIDLEYPFIKEKADHEIINIFKSEYREYLLSWLIIKYIPAYTSKLEESKKNNKLEQVLANIIYENGFCRISEKEAFIKGNLDINTQIIVFNRIFNMLSLTYRNNYSYEETKENIPEHENTFKEIFMKPSTENFKSNILHDAALISTLGISSKMNATEKQNKMKLYQEEIEKLQDILEKTQLCGKKFENVKDNDNTLIITEEIEKLTTKCMESSNQFKLDDFITVTGNNEEGKSNQLLLEDCVENNAQMLNTLIKTIQKKCDLNKIISETLFDHDEDMSHDNDYFACVLQSYAMSDNILQEINRNTED